jgi:branched-chain amino acid transport system substrate-binding protein
MKYLILTLFIFIISSCVTTSDLIQTHRSRQPVQKKSNPASIPTPPAPTTSAIKTESIHPHPTAPAVDSQTPQQTPTNITANVDVPFFKLPKKEILKKIKSTEHFPVDAKKVGAILPLSGKNASVGQRALAALRLGLGLNEASPSLSIALYDSQGDAALAAAGVQKLLKDNSVIAIFGGLSAKEASAISEKADFFEVPFFAFSQKSGLTDNSEYTFRNAVTAEMQVDKLAEFSFQKLSLKRFAILYPNDAYGVEFANKFWDQVLARGGVITAAQAYDPKSSDLNVYVQKMVGTYYGDDRPDEYKQKIKELKEKKAKKIADGVKKNSRENEAKESLLDPVVDFDAIFIPDSGRALGQAMAFLKSNDVQNLTYLGTNLWNTPDLVRRAGPHNQHLFFVDTDSLNSENTTSDFYKKYFALNQEEPQLLEAQTYEAAKIIREQLSFGATGRDSLAANLRSLGRRNGAYGEIRMNNNKELERDLTILTVDQGAIKKY